MSKDDAVTGSHTFETQEQRIKEFLDRRCGVDGYRIEIYQDDGISGGYAMRPSGVQRKVRPTLQILADRIATGECAGLVICGQSRLFRNIQGLTDLINNVLLPNNVPLLSATEDLDITTGDGRAMIYLKGIFDEKQRDDLIKRCKDGAATRAERGFAIGQVGYGWVWEEKLGTLSKRRGIVPSEAEKHWVLHIKERYLSGWNPYRIVEELNDLDVPSPLQRELWKRKAQKQQQRNQRTPRWTAGNVYRILRNPLHAGLVRTPAQELIQGEHREHRFWEPEVLEQIEQVHDQRVSRFKTCTGQRNAPHLLNGLIFCHRCGKRLYMSSTSQTTKAYRSYKCGTGREEGRLTCPTVVARADWVEQAVIEELSRIAGEPAMHRLLEDELSQAAEQQDASLREERLTLKRKLEQLQSQFERWAESYSRNVMTEKQFMAFRQKMQKEEEESSARLEQVEHDLDSRQQREAWMANVRDALLDFPQVWQQLDNDEKRQVLLLLLEDGQLRVDRQDKHIHLSMKIHLLPPIERVVTNQNQHGKGRARATGVLSLSQHQMRLLYWAGQGKKHRACAEKMGCSVHSLYSVETTIRKNLGGVSWAEAIEMTRDTVQAHLAQLSLRREQASQSTLAGVDATGESNLTRPNRFLSPVLMEAFRLFGQGATTVEAARALGLSETTVQGRRGRILRAYGTKSMFEAVQMAKAEHVL